MDRFAINQEDVTLLNDQKRSFTRAWDGSSYYISYTYDSEDTLPDPSRKGTPGSVPSRSARTDELSFVEIIQDCPTDTPLRISELFP